MSAVEGILFLGLLIIGGKVFEELFVKVKLPGLLGNVLSGLILGPSFLSIVKPTTEIELFTSLGIFFLFFLVGVEEIDLAGLLSSLRRRVFYTATVSFLVPFLLSFHMSQSIGMNNVSSLALAGVIGLSSLGVVAKTLSDLGHLREPIGLEIFSITAILEFVGLITISLILQMFADPLSTAPIQLLFSITRMGIFFIVASLFSLKVLPVLLRFIKRHTEVKGVFFGILIGIVLLFVYIGEINGVHGAMTALLIGLALSQMPKADYYQSIGGLRSIANGIFVPIFFAGVGLQITFEFLELTSPLIISFILVVVVGKFSGAFLGALVGRMKHPLWISSGVMAKGSVDLALMLTLLNLNLIDQKIFSLGVFSILLLLIISPLSMRLLLKKGDEDAEKSGEALIPTYARLALEGVKVEDVMSNNTLTVSDKITVNEFLSKHLEKGARFYNVVDKEGKLIGHVSVKSLKKIRRRYWDKKKIGAVMRKRRIRAFEDDDMFSIVEKMTRSGVSPIPVVDPSDTSKIIGTISRSDIMSLLIKPEK
ncbi:MAG: cation:proton antiporter [Nitrososphaerales archaeon]|jgi:Kef-type K+ transport system membrane component KefB|nr:cation:proton antiporter [Nitrososphaerales archaeon]